QGIDEGGEVYQVEGACPTEGFYYPPTLFTDVQPSSTIAQVEIFGPALVAMTFRTHKEAVKLANNTRYGLAASVWTDSINLALEVAPKIKAGVVWVNCTNVFDAAAGFGGYRESGFGREGGKEGLHEYMQLRTNDTFSPTPFESPKAKEPLELNSNGLPSIDKTAKMYIGGKQARPDGGYSTKVYNPNGQYIGDVSQGNRKDIRNAVEAASKSTSWAGKTGHARAQVLYFIAENMEYRKREFALRIAQSISVSIETALEEVELSIQRIYYYAAMADKYDGNVHHTLSRHITMAMPEAIGTMAVVCPNEAPLLGFVSTVIPVIAMGNNAVVIPSEIAPLLATDFYQLLETSDVPAGTVNIVTGNQAALTSV
ncbi:MAG: aldehyde dehydrogenase family protein, partial [Aureispira sp.]|nr:aldehyde dehydrogenase family protein [Aureispira sp.]